MGTEQRDIIKRDSSKLDYSDALLSSADDETRLTFMDEPGSQEYKFPF